MQCKSVLIKNISLVTQADEIVVMPRSAWTRPFDSHRNSRYANCIIGKRWALRWELKDRSLPCGHLRAESTELGSFAEKSIAGPSKFGI